MLQALIILIGIAAVLLLQWQSYMTGVGPVASVRHLRRTVIGLIKGQGPKNVIELGSGWGGMTRRLARTFPDAYVTGYEQSWLPLAVSKIALMFMPRVRIINADIFTLDLSNADLIFCYLTPWHMQQLLPKFDRELKAGAFVVSAAFPMLDKTPETQVISKGLIDIPVYLYRW